MNYLTIGFIGQFMINIAILWKIHNLKKAVEHTFELADKQIEDIQKKIIHLH